MMHKCSKCGYEAQSGMYEMRVWALTNYYCYDEVGCQERIAKQLKRCALCGHESLDAIQVGGHETGSQAPLALYHCLHIPSCQMRQKIMALVSEYADCRDDMHLPYVVREIIEIARSWTK